MQMKKVSDIAAVELINTLVLQVQFGADWVMEDSKVLADELLNIMSTKVIERIEGADLYSIRFQFENAEFLLNFEEYSHSCWFECAIERDASSLLMIKQIIKHSMR